MLLFKFSMGFKSDGLIQYDPSLRCLDGLRAMPMGIHPMM
jgi:hypothetical protein